MGTEQISAASLVSSPSGELGPVGCSVIPVINRLHDIIALSGNSSVIDLPQVAVVGSQSSGKSSVLEALVGRDFLPKGPGICTRRPLVLQLVHSPRRPDAPSGEGEEWGEFLHLPGKRFFDFSEICREIQVETDREAGGNKGVSDKQIRLKIFSPKVLNITLVDLPGITKVPVGDQPNDFKTRIKTIILSYIKHETCLILAVSPANADLANSDALQIARVVDPDGSRTIGVITKLDIMDKGTDARNFLLGYVIPLKLGYIGVVNRCQQDINLNRSIKDALADEEKFFRHQHVYHGLSHCCGIPQLAKKLNQILIQHIMAILPGLKYRINSQLISIAKEHAAYGDVVESKAGQGVKLLNILTKYCEAFASMIEGKHDDLPTTELSGWARIYYIFQSIFVKSLEEVDPCADITDEDIRMAIQNVTGPKCALFVLDVPFEVLVRRQIGRLLDPSLQCAKFVYDELMKMSHLCIAVELRQYPILRKCMDEVIGNFLREGLQVSMSMITHLIEMEMDYINTSHPSFIGGSNAVEIAQQQFKTSSLAVSLSRPKEGLDNDKSQTSEKTQKSRTIFSRSGANGGVSDQIAGVRPLADSERPGSTDASGSNWSFTTIFNASDNRAPSNHSSSNKAYNISHSVDYSPSMIQLREPPLVLKLSESHSEQETLVITIIKLLLKSYYDIVRKKIEDAVPKAIMHFLVNNVKRELLNVCNRKLYRENLFEEMLREPDDVTARRKKLTDELQILQQAYRALEDIPLEAENLEKGYSFDIDSTGLPRVHGLSSSLYSMSNVYNTLQTASSKNSKSRKSAYSGEQPLAPFPNSDRNEMGYTSTMDA